MSIDELVRVLEEAARAYHNGKKPVMSDEEFDALLHRLRRRAPDHPFLRKIGAKSGAVRLPFHMGSLDRADTDEDLRRWYDGVSPIVIMRKVDGVSALLHRGRMYTRGDGDRGQDVTQHRPAAAPSRSSIRGELYLPGGTRQQTAGIVNRKRVDGRLALIAYEVLIPRRLKPSEQLDLLVREGMETPHIRTVDRLPTAASLETLLARERAREKRYPIDGLVLAMDVRYDPVTAGNPAHAVAFKRSTHGIVLATVDGIEWRISRLGRLIPRVRLEPVRIGNEVVRYTAGFNARYIVQQRLGPGAVVKMTLSGDAIPVIVSVVRPSTTTALPQHGRWEGPHLVTDDPRDLLPKRLVHFMRTLGVRGFSDATAAKLIAAGHASISDVLKATPDNKFVAAVLRKLRSVSPGQLQAALGGAEAVSRFVREWGVKK